MIYVYTGEGEGKTCAAVGHAFRAIGQGLSTIFVQFFKNDVNSGEQIILKRILGDLFIAGGDGSVYNPKMRVQQRSNSIDLVQWVKYHPAQVIILDEVIPALANGLVTTVEFNNMVYTQRVTTWVLTGRGAPQWLIDKADVVVDMVALKNRR